MENTRKVAYLTALRKLEFADRPMPEVGPEDVLVRVRSVGICGSDVSYYAMGRTGVGTLKFPHVLGHECAGTVAAVGGAVTDFAPGDRVAVEPGYYCGECAQCREGRYNMCEHMSFMASAVAGKYGEGAFAEYSVHHRKMVYRLPDNMSFDDGAMLEPLSVAYHAAGRSGIRPGGRAAILGCGPIAGCVLIMLRAFGVRSVYMTDVIPERLARMKSLGASEAWDVRGLDDAALEGLAERDSLDAVFDTTCSEQAINASLRWIRRGGVYVQIGVPVGKRNIDIQTAFNKELTMCSSFRYLNTYAPLIGMVSGGALTPGCLVTHRFPFARVSEAFELAAARRGDVMKIIVEL